MLHLISFPNNCLPKTAIGCFNFVVNISTLEKFDIYYERVSTHTCQRNWQTKSKKIISLYKCRAIFFNVLICYGNLDNKFVFQQICRIPAPQFELFNTIFFTFVEFFCPIKLPTLAREKEHFNERDTHCKIKKYIFWNGFLFSKSRKQTYNEKGSLCSDSECRVCCPLQLISLIH